MADKKNNTGIENTGENNSGDRNSGDWNSGYRNSGDWNSGYRNSGDWNSGDWNSGYWNSGNGNSGYGNSGDRNSGDWNSGDWNSGDWNSGDWNSGDWNSGWFNTNEPMARFFNKDTQIKLSDFYNSAACPHWNEFYLTQWIEESKMTDEEKKTDPEFYVRGGYLKKFGYKEAWVNFWRDTDEENRKKFLALPNFTLEIFKEITGIDVAVDTAKSDKKAKILAKIEELEREANSL